VCASALISRRVDEIKDVAPVIIDVKAFEQCQVFLFERLHGMVFFLIPNVSNNGIDSRMAVRERSESFLPAEFSANPAVFVDESRGIVFDISNQIGQRDARIHADEEVYMIRYAVDGDDFLILALDDAGNVFM